jgi:predicted kinase
MYKIKMLIGLSGSGKSTYCKKFLFKNPLYRRVNRDEIRQMIFGYAEEDIHYYYKLNDFVKHEHQISRVQNGLIKQLLQEGHNILMDNTNLQIKYINQFKEDFPMVEFSYDLIDTPIETCIERDLNRKRTVGENIIKKQFEQLNVLKKEFKDELNIII